MITLSQGSIFDELCSTMEYCSGVQQAYLDGGCRKATADRVPIKSLFMEANLIFRRQSITSIEENTQVTDKICRFSRTVWAKVEDSVKQAVVGSVGGG